VTVTAPRGDGDWEQFTAIEGQAFGATLETTTRYTETVRPHAIARFARDGDRVVGGALALPCRQLVGRRPVPAGAVASVCVAPEARGGGVGRAVIAALVDAMREEGLALAPLWPSSVTFYRRLGWEIAGHVSQFTVPSRALAGREAAGAAVRDPDPGEVHAARHELAAGWCGPIDRPDWWWAWRLPAPAADRSYRYGWREDGRLTGFVAFRQEEPADRRWGFDVWVSDFWATTPGALDGLLSLLASDAALSPHLRFGYGVLPPMPDLVWRAGELDVATTGTNAWMLRTIATPRAIEASGWPAGADHRLELAIEHPGAAPEALVVEFAGGAASVEAGGSGRVRIGGGAFAAWYSGALRAEAAARLGLAHGPAGDLSVMDRLISDRRPWLPDMF
jgi:predicted acetyltransferase